jgi:hypothetical protein
MPVPDGLINYLPAFDERERFRHRRIPGVRASILAAAPSEFGAAARR